MLKRKLKGASYQSQPRPVDEQASKYRDLLDDYFVLQKESVSVKRKLQTAKRERGILMAEIQFLRQRLAHLMDIRSDNLQREKEHVPPQDSAIQCKDLGKPPRPDNKPMNGLINGRRVVKKRLRRRKTPGMISQL